MARIEDVLFTVGLGGWYCDDKAAIRAGAEADGYTYHGAPVTDGFESVRMPGEDLIIILVLDSGDTVHGDCLSVTYAGIDGREPLFRAREQMDVAAAALREALIGAEVDEYRPLAERAEQIQVNGWPLHTAVRYGLGQALLRAASAAAKRTCTETICDEYGLQPASQMIPLMVQSGDDRYDGVDKAILKRVEYLPHGLINTIKGKFGADGELLLKYANWIVARIRQLSPPDYQPTIHFDLYGVPYLVFGGDVQRMAAYFCELEKTVAPLQLNLEAPLEEETQEQHIEQMAALREALKECGSAAKVVADEWCNTLEDVQAFAETGACDIAQIKLPDLGGLHNSIEAVLLCHQLGVGAYLGGSCNETAASAELTAQLGLATGPQMMLAKPGMGIDEGVMIMRNEMAKTLAILDAKGGKQ